MGNESSYSGSGSGDTESDDDEISQPEINMEESENDESVKRKEINNPLIHSAATFNINLLSLLDGSRLEQLRILIIYFIEHNQRMYDIQIPSHISNLCGQFFGEGCTFNAVNKGSHMKLTQCGSICTHSGNGANTIYGLFKVDVARYPDIQFYRWKLRILRKKVNVYIGIDSNPIFYRSDFSNCFRDFKFTNDDRKGKGRDRFCAYSSDGFLYHYYSQVAHCYGDEWGEGDVITMIVDVEREALAFAVNDQYQGIAMDQLELSKRTYCLAVALFHDEDSVEFIDFAVHRKSL